MNLASSFLHSQRMQVEASAEAFKTQDRGNLGGTVGVEEVLGG